MTMPADEQGSGNSAQIRLIADQVADAAITKFTSQHPELRQAAVISEVPAPLKWAGAIIAGLFTAGTATLAFWLVSTVSDMQVTLARMDERLASQNTSQERVLNNITERVDILETYHRGEMPRTRPQQQEN